MYIYLYCMQMTYIIHYAYACTGCLHYSNGLTVYAMDEYFYLSTIGQVK